MRLTALIAGVSLIGLSACTDPAYLGGDPNDPNAKTKQGALIGGLVGGLLGAGESKDRAVAGAVIGAGAGALIGNQLDKQEADLRRDLANDQVKITNTGDRLIVTLPQDILFSVNSFAVRPDLQRDLGSVASNLQAYPDSIVQIVGHTDSDGDAAFNQQLSEDRANSVASVLINNGVPTSRIQAFGRGEAQPVASNLNPAGKAQNRRVEIVILPNAA